MTLACRLRSLQHLAALAGVCSPAHTATATPQCLQLMAKASALTSWSVRIWSCKSWQGGGAQLWSRCATAITIAMGRLLSSRRPRHCWTGGRLWTCGCHPLLQLPPTSSSAPGPGAGAERCSWQVNNSKECWQVVWPRCRMSAECPGTPVHAVE